MDAATDRALRTISVYAFLPAVALLIPYGILTGHVVIPLLLIPMFVSAVLGLIALPGWLRLRGVAIPLDSVNAALFTGLLIPGWISLARHPQRFGTAYVMLGTYGTVPAILNCCLHFFFVLRHLPLPGLGYTAPCPQCQQQSHQAHQAHGSQDAAASPFFAQSTFTPETDGSHHGLMRDFEADDDMTLRHSIDIESSTNPLSRRPSDETLDLKQGGRMF